MSWIQKKARKRTFASNFPQLGRRTKISHISPVVNMKSIATAILIVLSIGAIQCVDWSTLTEAQLHQLPPSAFTTITASELASIPHEACHGFTKEQVTALNVSAATGLTYSCLSQVPGDACSGFVSAFVGAIAPEKFIGWTSYCTHQLARTAFSAITAEQLGFLEIGACSGFTSSVTFEFPPTAAPGLSDVCLRSFDYGSFGGCAGLQGNFVRRMKLSTFEGFNKDCVGIAPASLFANINSTQMSYIPAPAFQGLHDLQVSNIPNNAWNGASVAQLSNFRQSGFYSLPASALKLIVNKYKLDVVNMFTLQQTSGYSMIQALVFKPMIPSQVPFLTEWDTVSKDLSTVTWLKIALLKQGDQGPVFNKAIITALPFSTFLGLRVDHVPLIAPADFKLFNASHTDYFTNDTVSGISADQLRELSPEAFRFIGVYGIGGLNYQIIPVLSQGQIGSMSTNQITVMSCQQLQAFTPQQLYWFSTVQRNMYDYTYKRKRCSLASNTPVSNPQANPPTNPHTPSADTPSAVHAPSEEQKSAATEIFLIVAGAVVGVAIIGGIIIIVVRRRQADPTRQSLLTNEKRLP